MTHEAPDTSEQFAGNSWVLPTNIDLVDTVEKKFIERLKEAGWDEDSDEVYYMIFAFREALINAIAHGNLGVSIIEGSTDKLAALAKEEQTKNSSDKKVYVDIEADVNRVSVTIRDEGPGFKWAEVADPTAGDAVLKSSGRGIMLMKKFFDSVTYNDAGNEVRMVKEKAVK